MSDAKKPKTAKAKPKPAGPDYPGLNWPLIGKVSAGFGAVGAVMALLPGSEISVSGGAMSLAGLGAMFAFAAEGFVGENNHKFWVGAAALGGVIAAGLGSVGGIVVGSRLGLAAGLNEAFSVATLPALATGAISLFYGSRDRERDAARAAARKEKAPEPVADTRPFNGLTPEIMRQGAAPPRSVPVPEPAYVKPVPVAQVAPVAAPAPEPAEPRPVSRAPMGFNLAA